MTTAPVASCLADFDLHLEHLSPLDRDWQLLAYFRSTCLPAETPEMLPPSYERVTRHIAGIARDAYRDPQLALATLALVDNHAPQTLFAASSLDSYLLRLETLWRVWHDIGACADCVDDMLSAGLAVDDRVHALVSEMQQVLEVDAKEPESSGQMGRAATWDQELATSLLDEAPLRHTHQRFGEADAKDLARLVWLTANADSPTG